MQQPIGLCPIFGKMGAFLQWTKKSASCFFAIALNLHYLSIK